MPSRKPSCGGRTQFAPTQPPLPKGRWIFAKQKDGGIPQADLRRTAREVGPYIVSVGLIVGNGFIRSAKQDHGEGTHRYAPTEAPSDEGAVTAGD